MQIARVFPRRTKASPHGWLMAVNAIQGIVKFDEITDQLVWPKGHRVGSVVLEINVACRKPENRNQNLADIIMIVSGTLNGAFPPGK
jgi:hypothetical protein